MKTNEKRNNKKDEWKGFMAQANKGKLSSSAPALEVSGSWLVATDRSPDAVWKARAVARVDV